MGGAGDDPAVHISGGPEWVELDRENDTADTGRAVPESVTEIPDRTSSVRGDTRRPKRHTVLAEPICIPAEHPWWHGDRVL
jgi:hypothetical protein